MGLEGVAIGHEGQEGLAWVWVVGSANWELKGLGKSVVWNTERKLKLDGDGEALRNRVDCDLRNCVLSES